MIHFSLDKIKAGLKTPIIKEQMHPIVNNAQDAPRNPAQGVERPRAYELRAKLHEGGNVIELT